MQIEFGVTALSVANANVHLDFDASGKLALTLEAGASAGTDGASSDQFGGCTDVSSTLAVKAGADASFFSIFDKSASVTLFSKTFDLFKVRWDHRTWGNILIELWARNALATHQQGEP